MRVDLAAQDTHCVNSRSDINYTNLQVLSNSVSKALELEGRDDTKETARFCSVLTNSLIVSVCSVKKSA